MFQKHAVSEQEQALHCTLYRWKSLASPALLLIGKTTKAFYSVLFKNCCFSANFLPFPMQHVFVCRVWLWGPKAGQSQLLGACRAALLVGTGALQELLPLLPKELPGSVLLTKKEQSEHWKILSQFFKPSEIFFFAYKCYWVRCLNSCF